MKNQKIILMICYDIKNMIRVLGQYDKFSIKNALVLRILFIVNYLKMITICI